MIIGIKANVYENDTIKITSKTSNSIIPINVEVANLFVTINHRMVNNKVTLIRMNREDEVITCQNKDLVSVLSVSCFGSSDGSL